MQRPFTSRKKPPGAILVFAIAGCASLPLLALPALAQAKGGKGAARLDASSPDSPVQKGYVLFQMGKYPASADAYELAIQQYPPEPRLYYYAGLANRSAGRAARARQLFEYVAKNFSGTAEGNMAKTALGGSGASQGGSADSATASAAASAPPAAATDSAKAAASRRVKGAFAFSVAEIAKEGAHGIDQSRYPNCWFEASMSALAMLPRGQTLLSRMIRFGEGDKYIVRFPGDGVEYIVSEHDADKAGITNKALWASLLECAQIKKFPNNRGAEGTYEDQSRLEVGMACITGARAEEMTLASASPSEISSFIGGAVRSQSPIVAGTWGDHALSSATDLVVPLHAYTIIGFDSQKNMVIFRNPHGSGARKFSLDDDPQHLKFEQQSDGVFKMRIDLVPTYFRSMARSFI